MLYRGLTIINKNRDLLNELNSDGINRTILITVKDWIDSYHFNVYFIHDNNIKTLCSFTVAKDDYMKAGFDYMECVMYIFKHNDLKPTQEYMLL